MTALLYFTYFGFIFSNNFVLNTFSTIPDLPEVIMVKGGSFKMGCTPEQGYECDPDEKPIHEVQINDFSISKYHITVSQYRYYCKATKKLMPDPPLFRWYEDHPILGVTYDDALQYCNWLGATYGGFWRLPTEAEYEFAARGGILSKNFRYSGSNNCDEVACNKDNSGGQTFPVGSKLPNELGIYDMSGNVWEWCQDWYDGSYYGVSPTSNPKGPSTGSERVVRGGGWYYRFGRCRVADRDGRDPTRNSIHIGFRVVYFKTPDNN
ncbi:MAG: formylglycine-generating enzyme family protein [Saprospiraceae bacterium]|nr:formylglycine-generating enzyme family protein [Saprospiraceae bacterium]